jgi:hypothetical protein
VIGRSDGQSGRLCLSSPKQAFVPLCDGLGFELLIVALLLHVLGVVQGGVEKSVLGDGSSQIVEICSPHRL